MGGRSGGGAGGTVGGDAAGTVGGGAGGSAKLEAAWSAEVDLALLELANRLAGVVSHAGRDDLYAALAAEAGRWRADVLTVAVAGDIKHGKSTLLNALVEHPEAVPTGPDIATSFRVLVSYGDEHTAWAEPTAGADDPGGRRRLTLADADQLIRAGGRATAAGDGTTGNPVESVHITVPSPLLAAGVVLVDTPGLGGLRFHHRDRGLAALQLADLVLFCLSGDKPATESEMRLLAEAVRTSRVWLVQTKSDHPAAEEILEENGRALRAFAGRLATEAASAGDRELAERLRDGTQQPVRRLAPTLAVDELSRPADQRSARRLRRSGVPELAAAVLAERRDRGAVRRANLLAQMARVLAELDDDAQRTEQAASGQAPGTGDDLNVAHERLVALLRPNAPWRRELDGQFQQLVRVTAPGLVGRELRQLVRRYAEEIEHLPARELRDLAARLPDELVASLESTWAIVVETAHRDVQEIVDELAGTLEDLPRVTLPLASLATPEGVTELVRAQAAVTAAERRPRARRVDTVFDAGVMGAVGVLAYVNPMTAPVMLPLQAINIARKHVVGRTDELARSTRSSVQEAVMGTQPQLLGQLQVELGSAGRRVAELVDAELAASAERIRRRREELAAVAAAAEADRREAEQAAESLRRWVASLRDELAGLLDRLAGGPEAPGAPGAPGGDPGNIST